MRFSFEYSAVITVVLAFWTISSTDLIFNSIYRVNTHNYDATKAASLFLDFSNNGLPACYGLLKGPYSKLTKAVVSIEYGSQTYFEDKIEQVLLLVAVKFSFAVPNLSFGPAQIRTSTMRRYLPNYEPFLIAKDECLNIFAAQTILIKMSGAHHFCNQQNVEQLFATLRDYNGQSRHSLENHYYLLSVKNVYDLLSPQASSQDCDGLGL